MGAAEQIDGLRTRARVLGAAADPTGHGTDAAAAARGALAQLAAAGLLGSTVPARDGGAALPELIGPEGLTVRGLCVLRDELAYHDGLLDLMLVMQGLGSFPIARGGQPELRARVLPEVASGESIAAYGLTEPGAGSSLDEIATRAVRDGDGWRLDGHKTYISNAGIADFYSVLARTSGEPGDRGTDHLSMFFVPADAAGLRVEPFEVIAPHPIGEVCFEGVRVPDAQRLGAVGEGLDLALATLATFRTTVAAAANGFARRALDESRAHLSTRKQFGRPLGANQGLRFDLAEMDTRLRAAQLLVREAAELTDAGDPSAPHAVARAKLFATEEAGWICDRAVQHHGGSGVRRGVLVEQLYREVRALRIYEGASEIQKVILGKGVLAREGATPGG
ncbi:acyl-CoA dehydrogenase family protein [Engelhardtia mirabilis]|uniref:Acyl-CoA dehydrogenase n=1 Tax=Engelhardtia mirabilis TaxID=2528011 RepID=A0A518BHR5_9BACT|nr:Acyl-CoA dehydrogenase [Planctomycetes bacterium Pla133]QDV00809.1 Acyl-CoA dehydrogenase [Planctomycetes bacterium Pla86]